MPSTQTTFRLSTRSWRNVQADGLVVPVFKQSHPRLIGPLADLDAAMQGMLRRTIKEEKFTGRLRNILVFRKTPADEIKARRIVLVGLGDRQHVSPRRLQRAYQRALEGVLSLKQLRSVACVLGDLDGKMDTAAAIRIVVDAIYQATYRSLEAASGPRIREAVILLAKAPGRIGRSSLKEGVAMARARSFAKDLVNMPANLKSTQALLKAARQVARSSDVKIRVQSNLMWIERNMPAFYTVAKGALQSDPPYFIAMEYRPKGKIAKSISLVGKSIVFDTGGYQIKPGTSMVTMKGDMTGGALVLGAMQAIAALKPRGIHVRAYLAVTANRINSHAMVPDSMIGSTSGKTIEIRHTDAEGRLTLIDAVAMAGRRSPDAILTVATLTGAAMRAVGCCIALMSNSVALRDSVCAAAKMEGDPVQTLDLFDEDFTNVKSRLDGADLRNTSRIANRGAQTACAFVMNGAGDGVPLAHMDVAGADMTPDETATGIGVRTIIRYLLNASL